jgi:signal transduction histidine kinase/ligand-binding sensor domain-containing protein
VPNAFIGRVIRGLFVGLVVCLAPISSLATDSDWFWRAWQSDEDSLPNNTVGAIAQTTDGYLWLGTPSGLVRFDGIRFEECSPTNFIAPPYRGVNAMLPTRDGSLWLGLDRGALVCLHGKDSHSFTDGLPDLIPNGLAQDTNGTLWIAYRGGSVWKIRSGKVFPCTAQDGLPEGPDICALASDHKGRIWFAKAGNVGLIANGKLETLRRFDPQPARLAFSKSGGVWFCSGFHLYKIDDEGHSLDVGEFQPGHEGTVVNAMLEDRDGAVWIGTSFSGVFRHDDSGFEPIETSHQEILSLAQDRQGNIWAGTFGGGLNRIRRRAMTLEGVEQGLPFAAVQSICQDSSGDIWAVTQNGGLARRSAGKWTAFGPSDGWVADASCVAAGSNGIVWIGTRRTNGLYRWSDDHFSRYDQPGQIYGQTLHTLVVARSGDIWMGEETPNAIQRFRNGEIHTFDVPRDWRIIRAMVEDNDGNIWAGTSKGVLLRFCGDQMTEEHPRPSGELASIRSLYMTEDGALLLGYAGWGIGRWKDNRYSEFRTENGLYDDFISHMVADTRGWLWCGADRGIFKVSLEELTNAATRGISRIRSIHYGRGEGLPSLQGTFGNSPDVLRSRDGRLWIPMHTALVVADPSKLDLNPAAPPSLLTRVSVDEQLVASYGGVLPLPQNTATPVLDLASSDPHLRLAPGHHRIDFDFAALSFAAPENIQFRYRLENFDDGWTDAGNHCSANYSRLPAGNYTFRIDACNSDGHWSQSGPALAITVNPFFWQNWWFRIAVLAGFTTTLIALVRYVSFRRLRHQLFLLEQQAALHKERARIAKDIHDDLGANLTQIAFLGDLAQQDREDPEKAAARSNKISTTARQAIKSLDEIVWAVNPRNDTLAHLIEYSGQFALDYLRVAGIRCRLDFPEQTPAGGLSTDLRHNLFLVIKEALNNVVKHSHANEVWLRARIVDHSLDISIEDNGVGFGEVRDSAMSDGLRNMRQRLSDIGGECRIDSQPGSGTKVSLHLPWPQAASPQS